MTGAGGGSVRDRLEVFGGRCYSPHGYKVTKHRRSQVGALNWPRDWLIASYLYQGHVTSMQGHVTCRQAVAWPEYGVV